MEYGILVAIFTDEDGENDYRVVGAVSSTAEAVEMGMAHYKANKDSLNPHLYIINRRDFNGNYTTKEDLTRFIIPHREYVDGNYTNNFVTDKL